MPAYAHVLIGTYYGQNYASIIHQCLLLNHLIYTLVEAKYRTTLDYWTRSTNVCEGKLDMHATYCNTISGTLRPEVVLCSERVASMLRNVVSKVFRLLFLACI